MIQCLKRCHSLSRIDLKNLLDEIDKVEDLSSLLNAIVEWNLFGCFSVHVIILFFQLVNILLFKELDEVEERMVSLWLFHLVMELLRNTCHKKLGE